MNQGIFDEMDSDLFGQMDMDLGLSVPEPPKPVQTSRIDVAQMDKDLFSAMDADLASSAAPSDVSRETKKYEFNAESVMPEFETAETSAVSVAEKPPVQAEKVSFRGEDKPIIPEEPQPAEPTMRKPSLGSSGPFGVPEPGAEAPPMPEPPFPLEAPKEEREFKSPFDVSIEALQERVEAYKDTQPHLAKSAQRQIDELERQRSFKDDAGLQAIGAKILSDDEVLRKKIEKLKESDVDIAKALRTGDISSGLDLMAFKEMLAGGEKINNVLEVEKEFEQAVADNPRTPETWMGKILNATAEMVPAMGKGIALGIPTAGAGSTAYWVAQGTGSMYKEMRKDGISHDTAAKIAIPLGAMYGAVEKLQVGKLMNTGTKQAAGKALRQAVKQFIKRKGIDYATENAEELIQNVIEQSSRQIANTVEGKQAMSAEEFARHLGETSWSTLKQSAGPLALLGAPAAVTGAVETVGQAKAKPEVAPAPTTEPEVDIEDVDLGEPTAIPEPGSKPTVPTNIIKPLDALRERVKSETDEDKKELIQDNIELSQDNIFTEKGAEAVRGAVFNKTLRQLDKNNIPYSYGRIDIGNLTGLNKHHKGVHAAADDDLRAVLGKNLVKDVLDAGGIVQRDAGSDEMKTAIPYFTKDEHEELLERSRQKALKERDARGLDKIDYTKENLKGFGALDFAYGVSEGIPGKYGEMDRTADEIQGWMKEQQIDNFKKKSKLESKEKPDVTGKTEDKVGAEAGGLFGKAKRSIQGERVRRKTSEAVPEKLAPTTVESSTKEITPAQKKVKPAPKESIVSGQEVQEPTKAQAEAMNTKVGHTRLAGFDVSVETPVGHERKDKKHTPPQWTQVMKSDYTRLLGTEGYDKDHLDAFIKPGTKEDPKSVFIVNQRNPKTGAFDEHKTMIGWTTKGMALKGYNENYEKGWKGAMSIVEMPMDQFKEWARSKSKDYGPKAGKLTDKMVESQKKGKIPNVLYRGTYKGKGVGTYSLGKGLYTSPYKSFLKKYSYDKIEKLSAENAYPKKPLILKYPSEFSDWLLRQSGEKNIREFNKKWKDPGDFVKSKGYDGVVAGNEVVKYDIKKADMPQKLTQGQPEKAPGLPKAEVKTEEKELTAFMKGSKILNPDGSFRIVYHGTTKDFNRFDESERGTNTHALGAEKAFFFAGSKSDAYFYADKAADEVENRTGEKPDKKVLEVYLSVKNPLVLGFEEDANVDVKTLEKLTDNDPEALDYAIENGFDGVVWPYGNANNAAYTVAVFYPEQIKIKKKKQAEVKPELSKKPEAVKLTGKQNVATVNALPAAAKTDIESPEPLLPSNQIDVGKNVGSLINQTEKNRPVKVNKVIEAIAKIVEVPIRTGKFREKALGIYKTNAQVIRIKTAMDVPTATHEMGHALHYIMLDKQKYKGKAKSELDRLGKKLYGDRKPTGGYQAEGFAEYVSQYLIGMDVEKAYPEFTKEWNKFLDSNPETKKTVESTRNLIKEYGMQGSLKRAIGKIEFGKAGPRTIDVLKKYISPKYIYEELQPFYDYDREVEKALGRKLKKSESSYEIAQRLKYTHESRARYMVEKAMIDLAGNPVGGSLSDAISLVRGQRDNFTAYLYAKRALERWSKGKNPGISKADAKQIVDELENKQFILAANKVYEWNRGVLNYVADADPAFKPVVEKISQASENYIPLHRVFDEITDQLSKTKEVKGGNPLKRMKGSGRRIRDPFSVMIENASKMLRQAHQKRVLNTIVSWADLPGMGNMIEKIPKSQVPQQVQIENALKAIEKQLGIEIDVEDREGAVTLFTPAMQYKGQDPILPFTTFDEEGKRKVTWYQIDGDMFNTLSGLDVYRLPKVLDIVLGMPTRFLRLGTTGFRASFALVRNPQRDLMTILMQTSKEGNPLSLIPKWIKNNITGLGYQVFGTKSPYHELYVRLGGEMSQYLGQDTPQVRRTVKELFGNKYVNLIKHPIVRVRDLFQVPELASRVTEIEAVAKQIGWEPGDPLSFEQSLQLLGAGQDVSTNFGAAGSFAKIANQAIPFFNASIQGARTFGRNIKARPVTTSLRAISLLTIPTLLLWWRNKDEEWYKKMPWYEKFSKWSFAEGDFVFQLLRPFEWGNAFSALPEALADAMYQKEPKIVKEAFKHVFDNTRPSVMPQALLPIAEQLANKRFYTKRPIVKMADQRRPVEEQYDDHTTRFAKTIGKVFGVSPYRVDHLVRAYFGGLGGDIAELLDLPTTKRRSGIENYPLINQLIRRDGIHKRTREVEEMYEEYVKASIERNSKDEKRKNDPDNLGKYYMLKEAVKIVRGYNDLLKMTDDKDDLNEIKDNINKLASDILKDIEDENKRRRYRLRDQFSSNKMSIKMKAINEIRSLPADERKIINDMILKKKLKSLDEGKERKSKALEEAREAINELKTGKNNK